MKRVSFLWMCYYGAARVGIGIHDIFFNSIAGYFLASYGLSNAAIGFLANERSLVGSVLQPFLGAWSDRLRTPIGRRKPFLILVVPAALGFLALTTRPPLWAVVVIFIIGPICLGLAVTAYEVLLADCVVEEQRGVVNGVNRVFAFAAGIGLLLVASQLWEAQPAAVLLLVAVSLAVGFVLTASGVDEPGIASEAVAGETRGEHGVIRGLMAQTQAARYVCSYFFFWFGIGGVTPFITRFANEELDIAQRDTFLILITVMVTTMLFAVPAGWLGDRLGKKPVTMCGVLVFALLILIGSQVQTQEQVLVVLALAGAAQAVPTVLAYPLFTELVPSRRMGELTGLSTMVWSIAQPLGATAFGALADQTGTLRTVLIGGGLALLVSVVILATVDVRKAKLEAEALG